MKSWTIITLLGIICYSATTLGQEDKNPDIEIPKFDKLIIDLWTGDESHFEKRMDFERRSNGIYGQLIHPDYNVGGEKFPTKEKMLDQNDVEILASFLRKAIAFPDTCEEKYWSSSIKNYTIIIDNDTIKIRKFCDWGESSYSKIEHQVFKDYFKSLKQKRLELEHSLSDKISGKWFPASMKKKLKRGEVLNLTRNETKAANKDCVWEFGDSNSFHNRCPDLLNIVYSKEYEWDVDEGSIYLVIKAGYINGYELKNYSATFKAISITSDEVKLSFLWD
ncbi:MAG: hypothetical protein JKX73_00835 [Flavobacteriales bacterium]|nr:hypothetical protein [Flavobacteriales bacterium]